MVKLTLLLLLAQEPATGAEGGSSFAKGTPLVAAFYYSWFDADSGDRVRNRNGSDALQDHPTTLRGFSFRDPAWHRGELEEMAKSGIDIVVPIFEDDSRREALGALAAALEQRGAQGRRVPRISLHLDSRTAGKPADAIREFLDRIPARHRAMLEGRPLVWLGPKGMPGALPEVRRAIREALGADPHLLAEISWGEGGADGRFAWGAAIDGPVELDVMNVGPGANETAWRGREGRIRDRQGGLFYERSWCAATRVRPAMVAIESWNGFHAATEICESREHGRKYLEITARAAERFHKGETFPNPKGPFTGAPRVGWNLKYEPLERGLRLIPWSDGLFEKVSLAGLDVLTTRANAEGRARHLYFDVDDSWAFWERRPAVVEVEYFDRGRGSFTLEYDSNDRTLEPGRRATKRSGEEEFLDSGGWKTARFEMPDAFYAGRQNGGADLRLRVERRGIMVRRATVRTK